MWRRKHGIVKVWAVVWEHLYWAAGTERRLCCGDSRDAGVVSESKRQSEGPSLLQVLVERNNSMKYQCVDMGHMCNT